MQTLKKKIKIFVGIPNLSNKDRYENYIGSVINHIQAQETPFEIMPPYITPPHAGVYHHGDDSRLNAIAGRMNVVVDKFMSSDATHVFINDGDVEVPPHGIDTLLRHNVDVASGVYPFHNFDTANAMLFGRMSPNPDYKCGQFIPRDWGSMKGKVFGDGERWSGGTGCMLIKRRVFNKYHPHISPLRFSREGGCGLDLLFWKRIQDAGFTARVDANVVCGHLPKYRLRDIDKWLT